MASVIYKFGRAPGHKVGTKAKHCLAVGHPGPKLSVAKQPKKHQYVILMWYYEYVVEHITHTIGLFNHVLILLWECKIY